MVRSIGFVILVFTASLFRLFPHWPNFTPLLAIALFAGAHAPSRWLAIVAPVASLWIGDFVLGLHDLMLVTGGATVLSVGIGVIAENSKSNVWLKWGLSGFLAAVAFFLITNFAVWSTTEMYQPNMNGLMECFVMGLPFFHYTLASTWFFSLVILGMWRAFEVYVVEPAQ